MWCGLEGDATPAGLGMVLLGTDTQGGPALRDNPGLSDRIPLGYKGIASASLAGRVHPCTAAFHGQMKLFVNGVGRGEQRPIDLTTAVGALKICGLGL